MTADPSRELLVGVPTETLWSAGYFTGFTADVDRYLRTIADPSSRRLMPRADAETDSAFKQIICYSIFRHHDAVFHYRRGARVNEGRLAGRRSIGVGGHVNFDDIRAAGLTGDVLQEALHREIAEEVDLNPAHDSASAAELAGRWLGAINEDDSAVGRVHFGVVRLIELPEPSLVLRDASLGEAGFSPIAELLDDAESFEGWSVYCLRALSPPAIVSAGRQAHRLT